MTLTACFLNTWSLRQANEVCHWLTRSQSRIDIYGLSEVTDAGPDVDGAGVCFSRESEPAALMNAARMLEIVLNFNYDTHFAHVSDRTKDWRCARSGGLFQKVKFGLMLAQKKALGAIANGTFRIQLAGDIHDQLLQYTVFERSGERYIVAHMHGVWLPENSKGDDDAGVRKSQSEQIITSLKVLQRGFETDKVIFGGDLNLDIDTRALSALESAGYRNLIREYGIKDTRTPLYRNYDAGGSLYADYVLVSDAVEVKNLEVIDEQMSDHAALVVTFK